MAADSASPIPVLPLVGSISVSPGLILPAFSASSIILFPIRSFIEPPALKNSHLTSIWHLIPSLEAILLTCTKGVFPILSSIEGMIGNLGCCLLEECGHASWLLRLHVHLFDNFSASWSVWPFGVWSSVEWLLKSPWEWWFAGHPSPFCFLMTCITSFVVAGTSRLGIICDIVRAKRSWLYMILSVRWWIESWVSVVADSSWRKLCWGSEAVSDTLMEKTLQISASLVTIHVINRSI